MTAPGGPSSALTERNRIEQELRESEERFRLAFEEGPIGMALVTPAGKFFWVNKALCQFVGYTRDELIGLTFQDITHPDDLSGNMVLHGKLARSEIPLYKFEKRYLHKDGTIVEGMVSGALLRGKDGAPLYFLGQIEDIRERKRAEEALHRQALRSETLLRLASDGIHVMDVKGNILEANDAFCRMLGYTREEALKLNVSQWDLRWSKDELRNEVFPRILKHQEVFETKHRRHDGEIIDVEVSAVGVEIGGEWVLYASARDITERKQTERDLRRFAAELTEANNLKDTFTDILRHDILNPVAAIKISTEMLLAQESDPRKASLLRRMQRSTANLVEMTENAAHLASLTTRQALEFFPADPVQALRSVLPDLEHKLKEKAITLTDHCGAGFSASFNPVVTEVFANLISNAIKYSPVGSRIDIDVEDCGESWVFSVKDQGVGVPDQHKQNIFNRFERLDKQGVKGSGLGLTITKQIVTLHSGEVRVEDNPSGGSIFFVRLPKTPEPIP